MRHWIEVRKVSTAYGSAEEPKVGARLTLLGTAGEVCLRTSRVVKVEPHDWGWVVETLNSVYEVVKTVER